MAGEGGGSGCEVINPITEPEGRPILQYPVLHEIIARVLFGGASSTLTSGRQQERRGIPPTDRGTRCKAKLHA